MIWGYHYFWKHPYHQPWPQRRQNKSKALLHWGMAMSERIFQLRKIWKMLPFVRWKNHDFKREWWKHISRRCCFFLNRHHWEALISSSCVGTVLWQHWRHHFDYKKCPSLSAWPIRWCYWMDMELLWVWDLQKPRIVESSDFLTSFLPRSLLVFAGICFESGYVQGFLGKNGLLKGGSLSSKCVYVIWCHMYSYVFFFQIQTRPDKAFHKFNSLSQAYEY